MSKKAFNRRTRLIFAFAGGALVLLAAAATALAVSGAGYTTVNEAVDGTGHCKNGNPLVNCNQYDGKKYVWLNGGPTANHLSPDGKYFFAVQVPGGPDNANDGSAGNLSDDYDTYTNRIFTVTGGEVSGYSGTHAYANQKIDLFPYADTTNNGGVYKMLICYLGPTGTSYPVKAKDCKVDSFKVVSSTVDTKPPTCYLTAKGVSGGHAYIQVTVQDLDSGIKTITPTATNATIDPYTFSQGDTTPLTITARKTVVTSPSTLKLTIEDVGGNKTVCDPLIPAQHKAAKLAKHHKR